MFSVPVHPVEPTITSAYPSPSGPQSRRKAVPAGGRRRRRARDGRRAPTPLGDGDGGWRAAESGTRWTVQGCRESSVEVQVGLRETVSAGPEGKPSDSLAPRSRLSRSARRRPAALTSALSRFQYSTRSFARQDLKLDMICTLVEFGPLPRFGKSTHAVASCRQAQLLFSPSLLLLGQKGLGFYVL